MFPRLPKQKIYGENISGNDIGNPSFKVPISIVFLIFNLSISFYLFFKTFAVAVYRCFNRLMLLKGREELQILPYRILLGRNPNILSCD